MAWKTGDPGIVFIDRINKDNPTPHLGRIESTNPCGEQPLMPYESCNLGSINLSKMVISNGKGTEINYTRLAEVISLAVRFLDNVIDVNKFPLPEIGEMTRETRKIGLGVMGLSTRASVQLAEERGVFPAFEGSIYDGANKEMVRNATVTTIAPTGTLSIIAGCSSGIEPLFALSYIRNILDGARLVEVNPYFEAVSKKRGFYSAQLMELLAGGAHIKDMKEIPDDIKELFVTAHDISPEYHVRIQAAFQKYTHNAVSKTVNFSHEATQDDVAHVYMLAYEEGLKGITIYRDRSRDDQPMSTGQTEQREEVRIAPRKRAKITSGITERVTTGCGYIYVTVNSDEEGICEVFSTLGKAGGCASAQLEATCRLISLALRAGMDVDKVVRQLGGIRCPSIAWEGGKSVLSCADAIASVLEKHINNSNEEEDNPVTNRIENKPDDFGIVRNIAGQCPDCGGLLAYQEGCFICPSCGYTKC